jgi:molecular chaperone DnaK (HSP70)
MEPREIDAVVRTGGSAQIPCIVGLVGQLFGPDKVVLPDESGGVTDGPAIRAATR